MATPIRYIGKRDVYIDGCYGTRIVFKAGESVLVPDDVAAKMLKHPDQYEKGDLLEASSPALPTKPKINELEVEQDRRDLIATMESDALIAMAKNDYGIKLDKRMSLENKRAEVARLVDRFGAV